MDDEDIVSRECDLRGAEEEYGGEREREGGREGGREEKVGNNKSF